MDSYSRRTVLEELASLGPVTASASAVPSEQVTRPASARSAGEPLADPDALVSSLDGLKDAQLDRVRLRVHALQTALHVALNADTAGYAIVTAVNRGGDTDTIGAVAGARFGTSDSPDRWVTEIDEATELHRLATDLQGIGEAE